LTSTSNSYRDLLFKYVQTLSYAGVEKKGDRIAILEKYRLFNTTFRRSTALGRRHSELRNGRKDN